MLNIETNEIQPEVQQPDPRTIEDGKRIDAAPAEVPTRPEGIPEELWDVTTNDVKKDELIKAYGLESKKAKDLRAIISKGIGKPAESVEELQVDFGDDLKDYIAPDDKGMDIARKAALEAGLPKEAFEKFVKGYLGGLKAENLLQPITPRLTPEEQAVLQKAADDKFLAEQMEILGDEGKREMDMLKDEFTNLYKKGSLTKEDLEVLEDATFDAKGVRAIAKLIKRYKGQQVIPTQHAVATNILSREELDSMGLDPRMKTDPAFRAKRTEGYRKLEAAGML